MTTYHALLYVCQPLTIDSCCRAASDAGVEAQDPQRVSTSTKHKSMTSSLALLGLPSTAEWLLLVTKSNVKLYPASAATSGKSRIVEEVNLDAEIDCAAALAVPAKKPMLVGLSATSGLQVSLSRDWVNSITE